MMLYNIQYMKTSAYSHVFTKISFKIINKMSVYHICGLDYYYMMQIFPIHYLKYHYTDVIMGTIRSKITSLTIVYSTVYSGAD